MATPLISPDSRRVEVDASEPHYHVLTDRGHVLIVNRPRFRTRQAARKRALAAGMEPGTFQVQRCGLPCRFTRPRPKRKPRKRCRHCGKVP